MNVTVPVILALIALVLGVIDEFQAQGRSLLGWAVIFLAVALLWGHIG